MSSWTPRIEHSGVAIVRIAYQFIQGGIIRLTTCGRMIRHSVCVRVRPSNSAASHCAVGTEFTAPRTISAMFAITGSDSPNTAFIQSGTGITVVPITISNGSASMTMNSRTSHGVLRNIWVMHQDARRTAGERDTPKPKQRAHRRADHHREERDQHVEQEALGDDERDPVPERGERLGIGIGLRIRREIGYVCALNDPDGNLVEMSHGQEVFSTIRGLWKRDGIAEVVLGYIAALNSHDADAIAACVTEDFFNEHTAAAARAFADGRLTGSDSTAFWRVSL